MKTKQLIIASLCMLLVTSAFAQPYTLDENIKPVQLELQEDKNMEGAQSVVANVTMETDPQFFFVKGVNMFQFIDVYIFSNFGKPNFKAELVRNTWNDVEESESTGSSENGIINFKLRTEGDFGFKVLPTGNKINYTIVVYASGPIQDYLGSAFKKANKSELEEGSGASNNSGSSSSGGSSNTLLYIILGVALLVIGFLAAKLMNKGKAGLILVFLLLGIGQISAQGVNGTFGSGSLGDGSYEDWLREEAGDLIEDGVEALDEGLDRLGDVGEIIENDERYRRVRDLYDSYVGLGDCINSAPPPGMPRIPSFCETADCGSCFEEARRELNHSRYTFERLKTIYKCTKTFTDRAIAFGDNVSGVHGVSGLAWQAERVKIEKSVKDLQKTYDQKFTELLEAQKRALMALNDCEAQYGIPDWYDRFGYMYYEFTAMNYKRND
ncbi:MAG: hypothetical protein HKN48_07050 [Flavobacteriaceae bacterium]|nr:hypothetical protein [Flavobacteriaceae bacterium]